MTKIFIDGSAGTTGLRIFERLENRDDVVFMTLTGDDRKNPEKRKQMLNDCDIAFLCLPDDAAIESVNMIENENVVVIDTSTAHRTNEEWAYGYPELSKEHRQKIKNSKRIAVPGCYATGFITIVYPLVAGGILPNDYPISAFAVSGYSGGGKKLIAEYEDENRDAKYGSARMYAWSQNHKHLKEMQKITGIKRAPLFSPLTTDYYSGMVVEVPLYTDLLNDKKSPEEIRNFLADYYKDEPFIKVMPLGEDVKMGGVIYSDGCSGYDGIEIYVTGNEERVVVATRFDNLGKGASGAAIQCLNIILENDETKGLNL